MINLIGNTGEGGLVVTNRVGLLKFDRQVTAQLTANEEEIIRILGKFLTWHNQIPPTTLPSPPQALNYDQSRSNLVTRLLISA